MSINIIIYKYPIDTTDFHRDLPVILAAASIFVKNKRKLNVKYKPTFEEVAAIKAAIMSYQASKVINNFIKPPTISMWKIAARLRVM